MPTIELIYDSDCPNVEDTRAQLREACAQAGLHVKWREWNRASLGDSSYARHFAHQRHWLMAKMWRLYSLFLRATVVVFT